MRQLTVFIHEYVWHHNNDRIRSSGCATAMGVCPDLLPDTVRRFTLQNLWDECGRLDFEQDWVDQRLIFSTFGEAEEDWGLHDARDPGRSLEELRFHVQGPVRVISKQHAAVVSGKSDV